MSPARHWSASKKTFSAPALGGPAAQLKSSKITRWRAVTGSQDVFGVRLDQFGGWEHRNTVRIDQIRVSPFKRYL